MTMNCTACGEANESGRKFCGECGQRLMLLCPTCGEGNSPGSKFCGECGARVTDSADRPSEAPIRPSNAITERRLVSVLFADLVGFTTFAESRDAEEVRAMLSVYFDEASAAIHRHGGVVEKFIGDAVMAVWGAPVAHEDDAERAVRAALEVVDRVAALGSRLGLPLQARAGVLTGEAVATSSSDDEGRVTGDMVNTAARLQSAAEPGTVLVGERTRRATGEAIAYTSIGEVAMKGKSEPQQAWRADRVRGVRHGEGAALEPPFIGRDDELRLAKDTLIATGRDGRARLLHLSGVAGLGKSRLVLELRKYVDGLTEDVYWHEGRCPSYGEGITFYALAEMVRSRLGIAESDSADLVRAALAECLERYVPDRDEREWMSPRLGHLLGIETAPPGEREELFMAWRRLFECVAEHGTVVLVVEDMQWADEGLMDFLDSLLEWSRLSPVLLVTAARPELSARRPGWGSAARLASIMQLEPLGDDAMRAMVTSWVDGVADKDVERIVSRAEGVPLYAVETMRMLADRGSLTPTETGYMVVGTLGEQWDVPETLHSLVAARLDALPVDERALIQDAAVAGASFTADGVAVVAGIDVTGVAPTLRELVRKEVLRIEFDPRSPERGQYRFCQEVIREVAYSTLSKAARGAKHRRAATWFAGLDDDDLAGVVAHHLAKAIEAEPSASDADELTDQALTWLDRAAERAASLGSPALARLYAEQALPLARDGHDRLRLHERAGLAAEGQLDMDGARDHLRSALEESTALGDVNAQVRLMTALIGDGDFGQVEWGELMAELEAFVDTLGEDQPWALAFGLAHVSLKRSSAGLPDAFALSDRAMAIAQTLRDDALLSLAAHAHAWVLYSLGRPFEAAALYEANVKLVERQGDLVRLARMHNYLANTVAEEDPRRAYEHMRLAAVVGERSGNLASMAQSLSNLSELAVDLGEWSAADNAVQSLLTSSLPDIHAAAGMALTVAMLQASRGDAPAALASLDELIERKWHEWPQVQMRTWTLKVQALCRLLDGDASGAAESCRRMLEYPPDGNQVGAMWVWLAAAAMLGDATHVEAALALAQHGRGQWISNAREAGSAISSALAGDTDSAVASFADVKRRWRQMDLPLDHAWTVLLELSTLPRDRVAAADVAAARTFLEERGGVSLLRLLDEAGA